MATWFQTPDASYANADAFARLYVDPDPLVEGKFAILGQVGGGETPVRIKGNYLSRPGAQGALNNLMAALTTTVPDA